MTEDPRARLRDMMKGAEEIDPQGPPAPPENRGEEAPPPEAEGAVLPQNDVGNGGRFRLYHGAEIMRIPRLAWHVWTGTHWQRDDDDLAVRARAQAVSERMLDEIPHLRLDEWQRQQLRDLPAAREEVKALEALETRDPDQEEALAVARGRVRAGEAAQAARRKLETQHRGWAKTTGNSGRIDAMLREAGVALSHPLEAVDADPLALNCESGTLRFRVVDSRAEGGGLDASVAHEAHDPADLITKCAPVRYDPRAKAERFHAFLREVQPAAEMRDFLQRWLGLSMSGIPVQKLAFWYGAGANGKSVLIDLFSRVLADYSATAPIEALTGQSRRGGSDATPELIPLIGARAVRASEPEQGERFREGMIKQLTSGEPIAVRALHSDFIFVTTTFKLTISGNHRPEIRGTDDGIWRRMLLVPWDVQIPEARRDPNLVEKLWQERDGVFAWLVEGLLAYLERGLDPPAAVLAATEGYRADSDPMGAFLRECCVMDGGDDFLLSRDLIGGFRTWQMDNEGSAWGERAVSMRLKEKASQKWRHPAGGVLMAAKRQATGYRGVRFTDVWEDRLRRQGEAPASGGGDAMDGF